MRIVNRWDRIFHRYFPLGCMFIAKLNVFFIDTNGCFVVHRYSYANMSAIEQIAGICFTLFAVCKLRYRIDVELTTNSKRCV